MSDAVRGAIPAFSVREWNELSPSNKWFALSALRGPDKDEDDNYKTGSTAIIRARMREVLLHLGLISELPPVNVSAPHVYLDDDWACNLRDHVINVPYTQQEILWNHFWTHIVQAADALGIEVSYKKD